MKSKKNHVCEAEDGTIFLGTRISTSKMCVGALLFQCLRLYFLYEAGIVLSLFLIFADFEPRCSYKIVLIKKSFFSFLAFWRVFSPIGWVADFLHFKNLPHTVCGPYAYTHFILIATELPVKNVYVCLRVSYLRLVRHMFEWIAQQNVKTMDFLASLFTHLFISQNNHLFYSYNFKTAYKNKEYSFVSGAPPGW